MKKTINVLISLISISTASTIAKACDRGVLVQTNVSNVTNWVTKFIDESKKNFNIWCVKLATI